VLLLLVWGTRSFGQDSAVQISLSSYSIKDVASDETITTRSLGIPNVLVGERVYLNVETAALSFKEIHWSISPPEGSGEPLEAGAGPSATFIADALGPYDVRVRVTTSRNEVHEARIWIHAGTYVGSGSIVDTGNGAQCINCHDQLVEAWQKTGHGTIFERGINSDFDQFDESCLRCHAMGYRDDVKAGEWQRENWAVPKEIREGNFAALVARHPEIANLTSVQCESCHGPGSEHMGEVDKNQISSSSASETCGYCHESMSESSVYSQYLGSAHVLSMDTPKERLDMNRKPCAPCHTNQGYLQVVLGGGESDAPYEEALGLVCVTCHDPHVGDAGTGMLRAGEVEKACGCHDRIFRDEADYFSVCPQGSIVKATGGKEFEGRTYPVGKHATVEKNCAGCHMVEVTNRDLADRVGSHTFKVATKGNGPVVMNTQGCLGCHESMSLEWMRASQAKTIELMDTLVDLLPKRSEAPDEPKFPAEPTLSEKESMASYNYYTVLQDGTRGVHNPPYIRQLLQDSIDALVRKDSVNSKK
jgi:formate-dependent nitrite reductase cytochrome c552 subunit